MADEPSPDDQSPAEHSPFRPRATLNFYLNDGLTRQAALTVLRSCQPWQVVEFMRAVFVHNNRLAPHENPVNLNKLVEELGGPTVESRQVQETAV